MTTWGVTALTHDASISVIEGGEILFAAHAERYSKIKNDPYLNHELIWAALEFGKPDRIVWFENRWLKKWRQLRRGQWLQLFNLSRWPSRYLKQFGLYGDIVSVKHHLSHAATGFLTSPFDEAAVLCVDSLGEDNTVTIWKGRGTHLELIQETNYPHSLGLLYSAFTQRCGLKPNEEEYILMGMASYGKPVHVEQIYEDFVDKENFRLKKNVHCGIGNYLPKAKKEDLAASIQVVSENTIIDLLIQTKLLTGCRNFVYGGGVALNCVANRHISRFFDNVWIFPNPGDAGSSLGCAAYADQTRLRFRTPYLGTEITGEYPVDNALKVLLTGEVVGVANGKAEFGPRALGNRSLFIDPAAKDAKRRMNEIKRRQKFRPFAPVILEEYADRYFDMESLKLKSSPYMQYTLTCRYKEQFPSVCHVDGTSRVQTVNREQNAGLYDLLTAFQDRTGCPMLMNTSLNIRGMPIVDDEDDREHFRRKYGVTCL